MDDVINTFYNTHWRQILKESIAGSGPYFEQMMALKVANIEKFKASPSLMVFARKVLEKAASDLPAIDWYFELLPLLQEYGGRRLPVPVIPEFFDAPTENCPAEVILDLLSDQPQLCRFVDGVFKQSDFDSGIYGFRTVYRNGLSCIEGQVLKRFSSVRALAHELGHCYFESFKTYKSIDDEISSEHWAMLFEHAFSEAYLSSLGTVQELVANRRYNTSINLLNWFFMNKELSETKSSAFEHENVITPSHCFFRPSYATTTGYQLIYGAASFLNKRNTALTYYSNITRFKFNLNRRVEAFHATKKQSS